MKVVSLISGGKDSCYNSMRCKEEAHEIICLANLMPANGPTELDSYMYQTVGSEGIEVDFMLFNDSKSLIIKAIAKASKLPLIRKEIKVLSFTQFYTYLCLCLIYCCFSECRSICMEIMNLQKMMKWRIYMNYYVMLSSNFLTLKVFVGHSLNLYLYIF